MSRDVILAADLQAVGSGSNTPEARDQRPRVEELLGSIPKLQVARQLAEGRPAGFDVMINLFEGWWQTCDRRGVIREPGYLGALAAFERGWHDWSAPGVGFTQAFRRWWQSEERADAFGPREYSEALICYQQGWLARAEQQH